MHLSPLAGLQQGKGQEGKEGAEWWEGAEGAKGWERGRREGEETAGTAWKGWEGLLRDFHPSIKALVLHGWCALRGGGREKRHLAIMLELCVS